MATGGCRVAAGSCRASSALGGEPRRRERSQERDRLLQAHLRPSEQHAVAQRQVERACEGARLLAALLRVVRRVPRHARRVARVVVEGELRACGPSDAGWVTLPTVCSVV